jgi:D-methionine transport system substrate-binding protein
MKIKKIASTLLTIVVLILSVTACGSAAQSGSSENNADDAVTIKLGVVGSIYEDLWAPAKEILADEGINLQIVQFSDYVTPNNALNNGDIDLNAFQHQIYLKSEIEQKWLRY